MNKVFWSETSEIFESIREDPKVRAIVLSGCGKSFSAGMDMKDFPALFSDARSLDPSRSAIKLRSLLRRLQDTFNWIEKCNKPVIAAIHGACVGAGVDMVCAADIRYCSKDAWFQIKELELGIAADVGTVQRLPHLVGSSSLARELIFTARRFTSHEALQSGFVSRICSDLNETVNQAIAMAEAIAQHSPVATRTLKYSLNYARDHGVAEGLRQMADWNQVMLQSADIPVAIKASLLKQTPQFNDA